MLVVMQGFWLLLWHIGRGGDGDSCCKGSTDE